MSNGNFEEAAQAFLTRKSDAENTPVNQAKRAVAPRGPSPEQVDMREAAERFLQRRRGAISQPVGAAGVNAKPMGLYPDYGRSDFGNLSGDPSSRGQEGIPVFKDEASFKAVEEEASKGFKPLQSTTRSRRLNAHHWTPPKKAAPYLDKIREVEQIHKMPDNLMAALVHQESSWNPKAKSNRGARGLAQIVPRHHPDANPDDPDASIEYGADYLNSLKQRFGTWKLALAAYNWGPGNLRKHGIENAPKETRDYIRKILGKVHVEDED